MMTYTDVMSLIVLNVHAVYLNYVSFDVEMSSTLGDETHILYTS